MTVLAETLQAGGEWIGLALAPLDRLGLDSQTRDAYQMWLRANRIGGAAVKVVLESGLRAGRTMFVTEVEPDEGSPYLAHVRCQPLLLPPPPVLRPLFTPSPEPY